LDGARVPVAQSSLVCFLRLASLANQRFQWDARRTRVGGCLPSREGEGVLPVIRNAKGDQKAMFKIRPIVVVLYAAFVLSAIVTSSASAGWFIEGKELAAGSTAALATTAKVDEVSTLLVPNLSISVVCSGSTLDAVSPEIIGGDTAKAASLRFLDCNTTKPATGCALATANQTIPTLGITATAKEATYPDEKLLVAAQTKNTLAEMEFNEANTCAFNGLEPVKGSLTLNVPTLQEERAVLPVEGQGSIENNSLEIGSGNKAFIDGGKALLKLASGKVFSHSSGPWEYKTESKVEGEGTSTFTTEGSVKVTCKVSKYLAEGLTSGLHETLSLAPSFEECEGSEEPPGEEKIFGGNGVTFTVGKTCDLRFNALKETAAGSGKYEASVDLIDKTCAITFSALFCTVTIKGEQLGVGKVIFQNIQLIPIFKAEAVLSVKFVFTSSLVCRPVLPATGNVTLTTTASVLGAIAAK